MEMLLLTPAAETHQLPLFFHQRFPLASSRLLANRETLEILPEIQGPNLAMTVLYGPSLLEGSEAEQIELMQMINCISVPACLQHGTYKTVTARFRPWLQLQRRPLSPAQVARYAVRRFRSTA